MRGFMYAKNFHLKVAFILGEKIFTYIHVCAVKLLLAVYKFCETNFFLFPDENVSPVRLTGLGDLPVSSVIFY